jgi:hypothetical protein
MAHFCLKMMKMILLKGKDGQVHLRYIYLALNGLMLKLSSLKLHRLDFKRKTSKLNVFISVMATLLAYHF